MAFTIESGKESGLIQISVPPRPLVLVDLVALDGDAVYFTTAASLGGSTRSYGGHTYQARLQSNLIEQIQAMSPQGYDIPGAISVQIADGDFEIWANHANPHGWRGANVTVRFVLYDTASAAYSTNAYVWKFIADKPSMDGSGVLTLTAQARQSMTRVSVPNFANQNRCGHMFPATASQRYDAVANQSSPYYGCGYAPDVSGEGNVATTGGPTGNGHNVVDAFGAHITDATGIYISCDYTRSSGPTKSNLNQGCMARLGNYSGALAADGDITQDKVGHATGRFTGNTYNAPQGWSGKQYTNPSAGKLYGFNTPHPGTGTTFYPIVYGTQWVDGEVLAPFGDPNSDRAEVIVCMAMVSPAHVVKVLVNGVEVSKDNKDVLFTYRVLSNGGRNSTVNRDNDYGGQGDPHGSMCWIEVVVPTQLVQAGSVPQVQVLVQGPQPLHAMPIETAVPDGSGNTTLIFPEAIANIDVTAGMLVYVVGNSAVPDGSYTVGFANPGAVVIGGASYTGAGGGFYYHPTAQVDSFMVDAAGASSANPVWALLDLLAVWGPFTLTDFDIATWYYASMVCAQQISYTTVAGAAATHARYRCSLSLTNKNRMTLAKAVLSIRNCANLILALNPANGLLQVYCEQTLADQQPGVVIGSNSDTPQASVNYANAAATGYLAYSFDGSSIEKGSLKIGGRSLNDTPNAVSFAFQDSANGWVQDTLTVIDPKGYSSSGNQEIEADFQVLGIDNYDQGQRRATVELAKALYGNIRFDSGGTEIISFRTSAKAAHIASRPGYICGITYPQLGL